MSGARWSARAYDAVVKLTGLSILLLIACSKPTADAQPVASASASASTTAIASSATSAAPRAPTSLADFLPEALAGQKLQKMGDDPLMALPKGGAAGAYLDMTAGKSININLMPVQDLKFSRAQFHKLKPGETKDAPAAKLSFKAFDVNGYTVERTLFTSDAKKSEARILLADKVDVTLSVQPTNDPDESIALIRQLDLAGIEAFAKKM